MLVSPRSFARHRPVLFGLLLFVGCAVAAGAIAQFVVNAEDRSEEILRVEDERQAAIVAKKTAQWEANGGDTDPLCSDVRPPADALEARWTAYLDCLDVRRRAPEARLVSTEHALEAHPQHDDFRVRQATILIELGRFEQAERALRLLVERAGVDERARAQIALARLLLFDKSGSWDVRRAEAAELLGSAGGPSCEAGSLRVLAAWPDKAALATAAQSYGDCAARTDTGELGALVEQIGVGATVASVEDAPKVVRDAPSTIARNFEIKSAFAMCAEAVPDAEGLRAQCMNVLKR